MCSKFALGNSNIIPNCKPTKRNIESHYPNTSLDVKAMRIRGVFSITETLLLYLSSCPNQINGRSFLRRQFSQSSVTDMATTRSNRNKEAKKTNILPPDLWVTHYQISRSGRATNSYYLNLRTGQKFHSKTTFYKHFRRMAALSHDYVKSEIWLNRETAEEEKFQICSRCKEIGHNCITCPYPIIHKFNPFAGTRIYRCSRCHYSGHNVRTCRRAVQN